jgi:hypothetical protein
MAIPFFLSHGDPVWAIGTLVLIQSLTIFIAYMVGTQYTQSRIGGLFTAGIFAVSFGFIVYARWLSGQQLSLPLAFLLLYCMQKYEEKPKSLYLLICAFLMGLLGQVQFINYLYLAVLSVNAGA